MESTHTDRLECARCALEGLSVGDSIGEQFFLPPGTFAKMVESRRLRQPPWQFTDDTNMALSVFAVLRQYGEIEQDALADSFGHHYDRRRGYGYAMHGVLATFRQGASWRDVAPTLFEGTGSFGNGSAMRIAPVSGYFADDLDAVTEQARRATEVTHAHPEAIAGGIAAAVAGALAWQHQQARTRPTRAEFIEQVMPHVPDSEVLSGLRRACDVSPSTSAPHAAAMLGNGSRITCQDTVPFTVWCAGEYLDDYENAIWHTISVGGDIDTTCAIVGGIVALYTGIDGIPAAWRAGREPLPRWAFED